MDKKKIALIVVVLFLLIGLGSFVFANPDQDNDLEGPGVSEDGGTGDGEVIDGTEPTATPEEENDDSATETDPITTYGNGGNGNGTGAGNNGTTGAGNDGTTGGVGNTDMSQYNDARRIIEELENRVHAMQNKDDSNAAVDYRTDTGIIDMVNNLPDGTVKDELKDRLDAINKVLDDTTAPGITGINNNDVTKENVTINVTDDNDVTITATLDGEEIEFTTPLTEEGHYVVTVTDKNFNTTTVEFTIDTTPIALDWLYVLNNSGTDYKVIGDGQKLYVELVFSEEFTSIPMIQIGNAEAVEMSCHWTNWQTEKQYFKCDATITIDGSTMGLENGKEVPVKITNVLDAAENETVLTNENITETEKYGHVIYDKQAPEMEVLRLTNVSRKDENGAWLQVAKAGDIVRVIVQFNENLATLPTLKVNGTEVGVMKYDSNMQSYTYDYKVTENDVNGVMQIEISNYADAAGNVGDTLTNEDINHDTQNQVVIDTVAPVISGVDVEYNNKSEIVTVKDDNLASVTVNGVEQEFEGTSFEKKFPSDGTYTVVATDKAGNSTSVTFTIDQTDPVVKAANILVDGDVNEQTEFYATTGDTIYSYVRFSEELKQNPKFYLVNNGTEYEVSDVTVTGPNDNGEYTYSIRYTITEDNTMTDGQIEMKVTGISDKAGNTIDDITKPTNGHIVYLDRVAPEVLSVRANSSSTTNNSVGILNQSVGIYLQVNEELAQNPTFIINGKEYAVNQTEVTSAGTYKYAVVEKVTTDMKEGPVEFTITNIVDKAGNVLADVVDQTDANQTLYIDNSVPTTTSIEFKNIDSYKGNENYANVGNRVWLYLVFNERLAHNPTVTINGQEARRVQYENGDNWNQPWEKYVFEYVVPEGASEGEITFHVSNVIDKNGNVAAEFDQTVSPDQVIIDTTAAGINPEYWTKTLEVGDTFVEPKVTFTDNYTASDELEVNYWCNVDTETAGQYQCYYSSVDKAGNTSSNSLFITVVEKEVVDTEKPVIKGVENNNDYSETRVLEIYDNSGSATVYIDFDNGYTSPVDLMKNVKPLNISNATEDNPYKLTIPKASGLSVYVVDGNNNAAFVTRVTINQ